MEDYVYEAVVEEESSEAGEDPSVGLLSLLNLVEHDRRHVGARAVVECGAQLSLGLAEEEELEGEDEGQGSCEPVRGGRRRH